MGDAQDWHFAFEAFSRDYFCLAPDLPGHGKNPQSASSFSDCWAQIQHDLRQAKIPKIVLIGYSMGGRLALYILSQMLEQEPEFIQALVLESTGLGLTDPKARRLRQEADQKLAQKIETQDFQEFLEQWYSQALFAGFKDSEAYSTILARRTKQNPKAMAEVLRKSGAGLDPDYRSRLSKFAGPVLYLAGKADLKYTDLAHQLQQNIPGINTQILNGGHNLHVESPKSWLAITKVFLEKAFKVKPSLC